MSQMQTKGEKTPNINGQNPFLPTKQLQTQKGTYDHKVHHTRFDNSFCTNIGSTFKDHFKSFIFF